MKYWSVPRTMWRGKTVAVLASGPSLTADQVARVARLPRIAVNRTCELAPDADIIYSGDVRFWKAYPQALTLPGRKVTIEQIGPGVAGNRLPALPADAPLSVLRNTGIDGFDPDRSALRTLNNSGAQAIQVAAHAGAARILLLGFDMRRDRIGRAHWYGPHADGLPDPSRDMLARCAARFRSLADELSARGIEVINCTPGSALRCFPSMDLADALEGRAAA